MNVPCVQMLCGFTPSFYTGLEDAVSGLQDTIHGTHVFSANFDPTAPKKKD
jgi:hypothetical protein